MGGADLIFTGKQAIDGDTAQVGPMLATIMGIPYVAWARKVTFTGEKTIEVERLLDHGYDAVEASLPAVISVVKKSTNPEFPHLKPNSKPRKSPFRSGVWPTWALIPKRWTGGLLHPGGPVFPPPPRGKSEVWEGHPTDLAARVWGRLKELGRR